MCGSVYAVVVRVLSKSAGTATGAGFIRGGPPSSGVESETKSIVPESTGISRSGPLFHSCFLTSIWHDFITAA